MIFQCRQTQLREAVLLNIIMNDSLSPSFLHLNDLFLPLIPLSKHKVLRAPVEAYFKVGHIDQHNKQGASDTITQTSKYIWS